MESWCFDHVFGTSSGTYGRRIEVSQEMEDEL
jgi:hypothetical protein